ncbi:restriction endonuclease subunit S [Vibrio parahaemolyticus]|uniref:restriction endonuclease subunit S n=1 Tax=Vibrio parahaemolyticus TaxID=670 RepID=UPI002B20A620|nr:restriction endonuclease subunit S [Vibrio parahaemolyticus]MEA5356042.1 restriction endonuclease subunit S [Vibrio parahaemolyticus]
MIQIKLKNCIETYSGYAFSSKDFCDDGVQIIKIGNLFNNKLSLERSPTFVSEGFLLSHHEYIASEGDILISLTGTLGKKDYGYAVAIDKKCEFLVNQRVLKISAKHNITQEYLLFLLQSEYLLNELYPLANGTKQANISASDVLNIGVSLPSIDEQKSISKLLGVKVSIIDTKVKNLTQKLHHLEEYKTALIHNAVTKGLDANNCRILDGTPESARLKDFIKFKNGKTINREDLSENIISDSLYLPMSWIFESQERKFYVQNDNEKIAYKESDEIVMGWIGYDSFSNGGGIGRPSTCSRSSGYIDGNLYKLVLKNIGHKRYFEYCLFLPSVQGHFNALIRGSVAQFIGSGKEFAEIPLWNTGGQKIISDYLDLKCKEIEVFEASINKKIALLLEYKKSLINEAVSGQ